MRTIYILWPDLLAWYHSDARLSTSLSWVKFILLLRACALTLLFIGFVLKNVQTYISLG